MNSIQLPLPCVSSFCQEGCHLRRILSRPSPEHRTNGATIINATESMRRRKLTAVLLCVNEDAQTGVSVLCLSVCLCVCLYVCMCAGQYVCICLFVYL